MTMPVGKQRSHDKKRPSLFFFIVSIILYEASMKQNYPKGEIIWVSHYDAEGVLRYITTSKPMRDCYYIYELTGEKFVRLGKGKDPSALEARYINF